MESVGIGMVACRGVPARSRGYFRALLWSAGFVCAGFLCAAPQAGESASYRLSWGIMTVGEVEYSLEADDVSSAAYASRMTAKANAFMRKIYNFHTHIHTRMNDDFSRSLAYWRDEESNGNLHETIFDWENGTVRYSKNRDERVSLSLEGDTQDPLSIIHAVRAGAIPREPGVYLIPTTDGQVIDEVEMTVHEPDTIRTKAGKFRAIQFTADFKGIRAIFARPEGALIHVWLSDDVYLFPLKLESEATIGSFTSILTEYKLPDGTTLPAKK